jgi:hypothetical protein
MARRKKPSRMIRDAQAKLRGGMTAEKFEQVVADARARQQTGESVEEALKAVVPAELQERHPEMLSLVAGLLTFDASRLTKGFAMLSERTEAEGRLLGVAKKAGAKVTARDKEDDD